jgi:hypothetical protein
MATDVTDLEAVLEQTGPVEAVLANGESCHWGVHLAARRPDLVPQVIGLETVPFRISEAEGTDALIGSSSVLDALVSMIRADYRTGLHAAIQRGNPNMNEADTRARIDKTAEYSPPEAGVPRLEEWIRDDASAVAGKLGSRLTVVFEGAGAWFPASLHEVAREWLPEANFIRLEGGAVSRPELTAAAVRELVGVAR